MNKTWSDEAWEDYIGWQSEDKKTLNLSVVPLFDYSFEFQQILFFVQSARIAREAAVCADDAVAGDEDGDRVASDRLRRHAPSSVFSSCFAIAPYVVISPYGIVFKISHTAC